MKKATIALFVLLFINFNSFGLLEQSGTQIPLTPGIQNIEFSPRVCVRETCRFGAKLVGPAALFAAIERIFGR